MTHDQSFASQRTLEKLEYDRILTMLAGHCSSHSGKELALDLRPTRDAERILRWQDESAEALQIMHNVFEIPLGGIVDVRASLKKLDRGGSIAIEEFLQIGRLLYASRRMKDFLEDPHRRFELKALKPYAEQLQAFPSLENSLAKIFDEEGEIKDRASEALASIRSRLSHLQEQIKTKLERMLRHGQMQTYLQESLISIRNDHYVLPVKAAYRQKVPGVVHDQSASGATLYIEPMAIVQTAQDIAGLELEERAEIQRILDALAAELAPYSRDLYLNWESLASLDLAFAKASLSDAMEARRPDSAPEATLQFYRARHPLIAAEDVVPIDIDLGEDHDCLVITGPNTGGKTVALKTLGLLIAMHQSGLQIPVALGSALGVFQGVYADIGDEQSIEQSLSTFSSHFTNIRNILHSAPTDSLILYDELGAGTDPDEGAALAVAILEHSMALGAKVVATTHYGELKNFAYASPRVQNASVEFDVASLRPTYRLMMGVSGSSNAFDISARIGIDPAIIDRAREYMEESRTESERMLEDLEESQYALEQQQRVLARQLRDLEAREASVRLKEQELKHSSEKIINRAKDQAANILIDAKRDAEGVSRELKSLQKSGQLEAEQRAGALSRKLSDKAFSLRKAGQKQARDQRPAPKKVEIGQTVHLDRFKQDATVISLPDKNGDFQVQAGIMKVVVNLKEVSIRQKPVASGPSRPKHSKAAKTKATPLELDIRGLTVDEAYPMVDKYLDDAYLQGVPQVQIIHGKGTGALRKMVQDKCRASSHVASYRLGNFNEGGDGVTVAKLN